MKWTVKFQNDKNIFKKCNLTYSQVMLKDRDKSSLIKCFVTHKKQVNGYFNSIASVDRLDVVLLFRVDKNP